MSRISGIPFKSIPTTILQQAKKDGDSIINIIQSHANEIYIELRETIIITL